MSRRLQYPQVKQFDSAGALRARLDELDLDALGAVLPVDDEVDPGGVLARPLEVTDAAGPLVVPNRFAILPMEGWDAERDGTPSDLVRRRWQRFGSSGAGLIWGGEAAAVRHDGRAGWRDGWWAGWRPRPGSLNNMSCARWAGPVVCVRGDGGVVRGAERAISTIRATACLHEPPSGHVQSSLMEMPRDVCRQSSSTWYGVDRVPATSPEAQSSPMSMSSTRPSAAYRIPRSTDRGS